MSRLRTGLTLVVITDPDLVPPRRLPDVVEASLRGGARAIQVREKSGSARVLLELARAVRPRVRAYPDALLFVNDRVDVALAMGADGVHLGPDDLPVSAVRRAVPDGFLIGYSTDDPDEAVEAQSLGADYIGCGSVFPTRTKDVGDEAIGPEGVDRVAGAVRIPVVAIGGLTTSNVTRVATTRAHGTAVVSAVMGAEDPEEATRTLLATWTAAKGSR